MALMGYAATGRLTAAEASMRIQEALLADERIWADRMTGSALEGYRHAKDDAERAEFFAEPSILIDDIAWRTFFYTALRWQAHELGFEAPDWTLMPALTEPFFLAPDWFLSEPGTREWIQERTPQEFAEKNCWLRARDLSTA